MFYELTVSTNVWLTQYLYNNAFVACCVCGKRLIRGKLQDMSRELMLLLRRSLH